MYEHGKGIKEDIIQAEKFYQEACFLQSGLGCYRLGVIYYEDLNPEASTSVVKSLFREACSLGEIMGCENFELLQKTYRTFEK
jgi:TPR repeat protein